MPVLEARYCTQTQEEIDASPILDPWVLETMTIGGEIDKMAFNLAAGREFAGVHYPLDQIGLFLGEEIAIRFLSDLATTYSENFEGFSLRKYNGERITVTGRNRNWGPRPGPQSAARR
eukprot:Selendium_serpulae@DN5622_c0_g1_i6.p2